MIDKSNPQRKRETKQKTKTKNFQLNNKKETKGVQLIYLENNCSHVLLDAIDNQSKNVRHKSFQHFKKPAQP